MFSILLLLVLKFHASVFNLLSCWCTKILHLTIMLSQNTNSTNVYSNLLICLYFVVCTRVLIVWKSEREWFIMAKLLEHSLASSNLHLVEGVRAWKSRARTLWSRSPSSRTRISRNSVKEYWMSAPKPGSFSITWKIWTHPVKWSLLYATAAYARATDFSCQCWESWQLRFLVSTKSILELLPGIIYLFFITPPTDSIDCY
jgi:hypothetical protein